MATDTPATFADLALRDELLQALTRLGYEEPTPIQREAIGPLIAGRVQIASPASRRARRPAEGVTRCDGEAAEARAGPCPLGKAQARQTRGHRFQHLFVARIPTRLARPMRDGVGEAQLAGATDRVLEGVGAAQ